MITVTDLFCGGGGSSTGLTQVPGFEIAMAANHWPLAVEVHNRNHPDSDHAAVDLHEEDPRYFPRTDMLWASPECTKWSQAGGNKYTSVAVEGRDGKEARPMWMPGRTQTTRSETAILASPLHVSLMGGGDTHVVNSARPVDRELRTLTAEGNNDYLLTPYYGSAGSSKPITDPIGTLTTHDRYALLTRHNGSRGDGAEMTTPVHEAMRTLTTTAQQSILTPGDLEAAEAQVDDCLFRMLEPHEVAAGMAFPADYMWGGNRRERVKLAGNAVTPPAARDLGSVLVETLGGAA